MAKQRYIISGGGTGGHIYPGLALADFIVAQNPEAEVHFVGAEGGMEEKIIPFHGYPLHLLRVGRLHKSVGLWRRLKSLLILPLSLIHSFWLYWSLRPQWVLGMGGFASGPFVLVSSLMGGRTAVFEPNAYPGLANRYLSHLVSFCFVVFKETGEHFPKEKVVLVGLPVRTPKKQPKLNYDGSRPFRILIFGGSQGARGINKVVGDWVENLSGRGQDFEILHQIGKRDYSMWQERYADHHKNYLTYVEYINDMPEKLDWADLVICRSGMGTVAEIAMSSRPAIFIPLPTAADNHQVKNAESLVSLKAARMLEEKDLDWQKLDREITHLKDNPQELLTMMNQLKQIDYSTAQEQIFTTLTGK
jgi:UDP-N-acetylglucosamine--N-acetylmuramyl-(pentapeptide) pyrophosphoryl-undecaprenol N-acetylglucosamine transferase